ncbi:signal peptidase I [Exophiala mesophila]|uniref:Mitochondrial inner membrane protease subunit n=1 Tax=Exophiala mesophila TaxID=212818 RepID=A0A0D1ZHY8_EXOME|nr:signal peptidase I [Exophiala mesophila]KIV93459.1 signal peptidase I [Exophiala mesophila]
MPTILRRILSSRTKTPQIQTSTHRTPVSYVIQMVTAGVAIWASTALISHHVITTSNSIGPSMYPSMPETLSVNIISRRHQKGKNIRLGDVIIFDSPIFPRGSACKRVVGMPGDYILRDEAQSPNVAGAVVYGGGSGQNDKKDNRAEPLMVQVPEGHVWVAGDNLPYSRDSRFYGPVPMALITGKLLYNGDGWFNWRSFRKEQLVRVDELEELG